MSAAPESSADPMVRLREEADARTFARFDPVVLSRLALIPEWTEALADAVGLWTPRTGPEALEVLRRADIIDQRLVLARGGHRQQAFWVRARARPSLASYLQTVRPRLERDLDQLVKVIGRLEMNVFGLTAWFAVAAEYRRDSTGLSLVRAVDELVGTGQLADATDLVGAARVLGEVTGGPLIDAGRRAGWHVERAYRTAVDNEALRLYVNRAEVENALDELIGPTPSWALHLIGDGGVGKTMVVRYLASGRYAADRGRPLFPVARADFDYLDPRYPQERPAELLLALAHELVSFGDSRAVYKFFRQFQDAASHLHEECARPYADGERIGELQAVAVRQFARVVAEASGPAGRPVVLILDTCEELAKLYPPGARAPAIDRTFGMFEELRKIEEELREQAPAVRLLLAGRRWLTPAADAGSRAAGPKLLPRPYLRVLRVPGLSASEAADYIDRCGVSHQADRPPGRALRDAILYRARDPDGSRRYNPFELASYCEWAFSDTPPDARELRDAPGDPYVELRIIGRIMDDAVRQALPVAVEFGRFDVELIRPALARQGLDADTAFAGLAAQEWVRALTVTANGLPGVVEVDEHLRDRIRSVLFKTNAYTTGDPVQLGRDAAELIMSGPLRDVPAEVVEAAVRLLPVTEAAVMWQRLEAKAVTESAWSWAETVTVRAGAVEVKRTGKVTILAAILATQAAARIHGEVSEGLADLWLQVADASQRYPGQEGASRLMARATLGRIAVGVTYLADDDKALARAARLADAGSLVAALDGPIGRGQRPPSGIVHVATDAIESAVDSVSRAGLQLALATLALQDGRLDEAAALADGALAAAMATDRLETALAQVTATGDEVVGSGEPSVRDCADWRRPPGLIHRCRLARLLIACQRGERFNAEQVQSWRQSTLDHTSDADAQRLAAFTVQFELGQHPVPAEALSDLETEAALARATTWLHRQVRPLAAEAAEAWCVLGDPARADQVLRVARGRVVAQGDDPETIEALQLAQLSLCRRCRTAEYASPLQLAYSGTAAVRAEAWLLRTLLTGDRPQSTVDAGSWHGWWRCQDVRSLPVKPAPPPKSEPGIPALDSLADHLEYEKVTGRPVPPATFQGIPPASDERAVRLWLLMAESVRTAQPDGTVGRALLAAGEVLALRLPELAASGLSEAARRLSTAGDDLGAAQARVLADLALARAGRDVPAADPLVADSAVIERMAQDPQWSGWSDLITAWQAVTAGLPPPALGDPSPELNLPTSSPTSSGDSAAPQKRRQPRLKIWRGSIAAMLMLVASSVVLVLYGIVLLAGVLQTGGSSLLAAGIALLLGTIVLLAVFVGAPFVFFLYSTERVIPIASRAISIRAAGKGKAVLAGRTYGGTAELKRGSGRAVARVTRFLRRISWSAEVALDSPGPVNVRGLLGRLRWPFGYMLMVLEIDPRLEAYPWEQWLGRTLPTRRRRRLLFVRTTPDPPILNAGVWPSASAVYLGPRALAPPKPVLPRPTASEKSQSRQYRRVMYLVGTPVPTAAGWHMRVSPAASAETVESSRGAVTGEELVSMDGLDLSGTRLVVLQAEPRDGPPHALGDMAPGFRALARDAVEAGAGLVLVVPTLPDKKAAGMISTTWSRFAARRRQPQISALYILMAKAKAHSYTKAPSSGDVPVLDVLAFVRVPQQRKVS